MVTVVDGKLTFSRDQVVTSSQASKNFGEMRRRARQEPLYVSDRNDGIDTVIVGFDEFEQMALELEALRLERLYSIAADRVAVAEQDASHRSISLEDTIGQKAYRNLLEVDVDSIPDDEVFE